MVLSTSIFAILTFCGVIAILLLERKIYAKLDMISHDEERRITHFTIVRDRQHFNSIGIEILNGAMSYDTFYLILRSGTFNEVFRNGLEAFVNREGTRLIFVVPDKEVFLSNLDKSPALRNAECYENPNCEGMRALLLEPGKAKPDPRRMVGYLYLSDAHNHDADEGFYTNSRVSAEFLLAFMKLLIKDSTCFQTK
jgi:hypothetical protein